MTDHMGRTLADAIKAAAKLKDELPHIVQVYPSDHDTIIMAAEIERLRDLIGITGGHWLALQLDHPIKWEGSIDAAMEAACAEIERLRSALKRIASGWPKPMQLARETLEK